MLHGALGRQLLLTAAESLSTGEHAHGQPKTQPLHHAGPAKADGNGGFVLCPCLLPSVNTGSQKCACRKSPEETPVPLHGNSAPPGASHHGLWWHSSHPPTPTPAPSLPWCSPSIPLPPPLLGLLSTLEQHDWLGQKDREQKWHMGLPAVRSQAPHFLSTSLLWQTLQAT